MKIVNCHVHLIDLPGMLKAYPNVKLPRGISAFSEIEQSLPLIKTKTLLKQMDEAGIERSILYSMYAPVIYAPHEFIGKVVKKHPDRLTGFASCDPKKPDALDTLKKGVEEYGMKGIKLHPALQDFFPNDKKYFFIYEAAMKWGIPVVFHVGSTIFGHMARLSQANPLLIDDISCEFPDLRILLTHLGTLWQDEAFMVVEKNPYVFIDTAAYLYEIPEILTPNMVSRIGEDKIIFGTDYPQPSPPHPVHHMRDFVKVINDLNLSNTVKEKIFSGNFGKLLSSPKDDIFREPMSLKKAVTNLLKMI